MDDRTFKLIVGILATSTFVVVASGILRFNVPGGFWAIPGGIITLLTMYASRRPPLPKEGKDG